LDQIVSPTPAPSGDVLSPIRPANQTYFPALDGIRALAFLMVFVQHYLEMPWGWTGVDIFFVLSGFLITGILYDTCEQPHRVRNFYIRRTLRIFPLYYGIMFLLLLAYPFFHWQWSWAWLLWPAYLGNFCRGIHPFAYRSALQMLADFQPLSRTHPGVQLCLGHFWSLCVEEQFYLVWPWVVFWIRDRRKLMRVCLACMLVCPVMRIVGSHTLPQFMLNQDTLYRWTPFRVDGLLLGGFVALVRRGSSGPRLLVAARATFCVLATILVSYLLYEYFRPNLAPPAWASTWGISFADLFSVCLIVMALETGSIPFRIFNVRPLRWLGRISYGAYVFHDIYHRQIDALVTSVTGADYADAPVALVFTLLLAWASFRFYERPFVRLKERWTRSAPQNQNATP
jgi:peptidoglycan/LPS O-acetylase OafA/YrhL